MKILVDKSVIELALSALQDGLWDYGPGQDEHEKCNEVIAVLEDTLAQSADGMPVIKHCDVCGSDYWDGSRHPYPIYVANETIPEGFRTMEVRMKELQETKGEQIEAARQRLEDMIDWEAIGKEQLRRYEEKFGAIPVESVKQTKQNTAIIDRAKVIQEGFRQFWEFHGIDIECTAPVRTKDLTDDEIWEIWFKDITLDFDERCRAVIAADREKNK